MVFNPIKSVNSRFLNFIRYFYNPDLQYVSHLRNKWIKAIIQIISNIFVNGLIFYLFLSGLGLIFPNLTRFFYLGAELWHFPFIIFSLGLIILIFEERYEYLRGGYKK